MKKIEEEDKKKKIEEDKKKKIEEDKKKKDVDKNIEIILKI